MLSRGEPNVAFFFMACACASATWAAPVCAQVPPTDVPQRTDMSHSTNVPPPTDVSHSKDVPPPTDVSHSTDAQPPAHAFRPEGVRADPGAPRIVSQTLFEDGRALLFAGKYAEACPKLAESLRLDPAAGTEINLAHCYEKIGRLASAWAAFKDAAGLAQREGRGEWAAVAEMRAGLLFPRVPTLAISIAPRGRTVDGMDVYRDGQPLPQSAWGSAFVVDPGRHRIEATAPGATPWLQDIDVEPGTHLQIEVPPLVSSAPVNPTSSGIVPLSRSATALDTSARPLADARTIPGATDTPGPEVPRASADFARPVPSNGRRTTGIVLISTGAAAVAAGLAMGTWAIVSNGKVESDCPGGGGPCKNTSAVHLSHEAVAVGDASTVAVAVGAALAAAGAWLFLTTPSLRRAAHAVVTHLVATPLLSGTSGDGSPTKGLYANSIAAGFYETPKSIALRFAAAF